MNFKLLFLHIICISLTLSNVAQNYRVIDIDDTKFPAMEAQFFVNDFEYCSDSININDISVFENNHQQKIQLFKAPKSTIAPTSIALVLDVSGSMEGKRMEILKKTAKAFISSLPLEITEVSIASFNAQINLQCDFTQNVNTLNKSVDRLFAIGGTHFNNAFLTPYVGALSIMENAQFRKVIIFISDGQSEVKKNLVVNKAVADSIIISCMTIGLPMSSELRHIAKQTGGNIFSGLVNEEEISHALDKIYFAVQINSLGKIKWTSNYSCNPELFSVIKIKNDVDTIHYSIPKEKVGKVVVTPSTVFFSKGSVNVTEYKPIYIFGDNIETNITEISNNSSDLFGIENTKLPFKTAVNAVKQLNLSFTPKDSIYTTSLYTIKNPGCPDIVIDAVSGGQKKLKFTHPTKEDKFIAGSLIPIGWKGIEKSTPVHLSYQIKDKEGWVEIGEHIEHECYWQAPGIDDSIRIKGEVTNNISKANLINSSIAMFDDYAFKKAFFNSDGSEIISISRNGIVKSWNVKDGVLRFRFEGLHFNDVAYFPGYNRVVSISDSICEVLTNRNGMKMKELPFADKKVRASFTHIEGKALYVSIWNYSNLGTGVSNVASNKSKGYTTSLKGKYGIGLRDSKLSVIKNSDFKRHFNINLDGDFEKAILHQRKNIVSICSESSCIVYNLDSKKMIKKFDGEKFKQFSASGKHLITADSADQYIYEIETGKLLTKFPKHNEYSLSRNGRYLAQLSNDSLWVTSFSNQGKILVETNIQSKDFQFFPVSNRMLYIKEDSLSIYNIDKSEVDFTTFVEPGIIEYLDISPDEKSLLITTKHIVAIWDIQHYSDEDVTSFFSIISLKPIVKSSVGFGREYVSHSKELVIKDLIVNKNAFPVFIDSIYFEEQNSAFSLISYHKRIMVEANSNTVVELKYHPTDTGKHTANLIVVSSGKQFICEVSGVGINNDYTLLNAVINYGEIKVGDTKDSTVAILKNTGTNVLQVEMEVNKSNNFRVQNVGNSINILPNDTLWINTDFIPTTRGRQSTSITMDIENIEPFVATVLVGEGIANRNIIVQGRTIVSGTDKSLESQIICTELSSQKIIYKAESDAKGQFIFALNTDLNYSLVAQLDGYFSSSENIDLRIPQFVDTVFVELELSPVSINQKVALNNIFFESGKAELLNISKSEIKRVIDLMNEQSQLNIEIHGHTDNLGDIEKNKALSQKRAKAVFDYMVINGVGKNRMAIKHFGETKPIESNNTPEGRKANRRVEIKFVK